MLYIFIIFALFLCKSSEGLVLHPPFFEGATFKKEQVDNITSPEQGKVQVQLSVPPNHPHVALWCFPHKKQLTQEFLVNITLLSFSPTI